MKPLGDACSEVSMHHVRAGTGVYCMYTKDAACGVGLRGVWSVGWVGWDNVG